MPPAAETLNRYLFEALIDHADRPMQWARSGEWSYRDAACAVHGVAEALTALGVQKGDRVGLLAENRPQWLHAYLAILAKGAIVVPRGEDTPADEIAWILEHSGCKATFVGSKRMMERTPPDLPRIPLYDDGFPAPVEVSEATLRQYAAAVEPEDPAVLLYTSGTTGRPKGVVLEQRNIAHNLRTLPDLVQIEAGDVWVSVLPVWHTFEQTVEMVAFSQGCTTAYSDKRRLREDLQKHRPHYFASVPRIWEAVRAGAMGKIAERGALVRGLFRAAAWGSRQWRKRNPLGWPLHRLGELLFYKKIRAATGGRMKYAVSGGGYLPPEVDDFFANAGVNLLIGYGLTETAPVVALRRPEANRPGTIGRAVPETEIRVGKRGTFEIRGPQVMRGYYKDDELTKTVLDDEGWFDTGDLGRMTPEGDLVFLGRLKETIVLAGGENVEPEPLEKRLCEDSPIAQAMLVGQDRKTLGVLVVLEEEAAEKPDGEEAVRKLLRERSGPAGGFRPCEVVNRFRILAEGFDVENGLMTPTLKMKRHAIAERYQQEIAEMYA